MALANVALTDSFDTWRIRTNQVVSAVNDLFEGNYLTSGTISTSNTDVAINVSAGVVRIQGNTFTSNQLSLVSNSATLTITSSNQGRLGSAIYFDVGALSVTTNDQSTSNIASANSVNVVSSKVVVSYTQANNAYIRANNAYDQSNNVIAFASLAYDQANGAYAQANGVYAQANGAYDQANGAYAQANVAISDAANANTLALSAYNLAVNAAAEIFIGDETTSSSLFYPTFTANSTGSVAEINVSSSKLTFNPSTGTLSSTIFNSLSDASLKENVTKIDDALSVINSISGVSFTWKDNGNKSYGVIAQEVEKTIPELVSDINNVKTVNYDGIIAFLIEAIKQLNAKLEEKN